MPQKRQRHQRRRTHGAQCLQVLRPLGNGFKLLRGDMFDKQRLFRVKHGSEQIRTISIDWDPLQNSANVHFGRVPASNLYPPDLFMLVDDLDHAPVGERRDHEVGDLLVRESRYDAAQHITLTWCGIREGAS